MSFDLHDRRVQIKRQRVFDVVLLCRAVGVFIKDVDASVDGSCDFVILHHVGPGRHAVKDHELRARELIDRQLAHVLIVGQKRGSRPRT